MKRQAVSIFQFVVLLGLSALIHYILFVFIGFYQQDDSVSNIFMEYQTYIYAFITSLLMGVFYGQMYRERKNSIWKVLAIVHGNILSYYYLVSVLELSESIASVLIAGSLIGWLIVYGPIKQKFWLLVTDVVVVSSVIVLESIPVYNKTVSLEILLSQEENIIYSLYEVGDNSSITIETDTSKRHYTISSLWQEPLHLRSDIKKVTYNSSSSTGNIVLLKTRNGLFVAISPQTQLILSEQKNKAEPLLSTTAFEIVIGNVHIYPISEGVHHTQNPERTLLQQEYTDEQVMSYISTYLADVTQRSRQLFGWEYTDARLLENIILYKMLLYQFFDYQRYTPMVENFYTYLYLVYGELPPFTSDILFFPIEKTQNKRIEPREEVNPIDQINKGISKSWSGTRVLGERFGK